MKKKFLIVGLGNPGFFYKKTRHNLGFLILDKIAEKKNIFFLKKKLGFISILKYNEKLIFFLKPSTYINNSGISVKYWIKKEKILLSNILIISDDIYLKFGIIRLRRKGSSGGHNGLKSIENEINTNLYTRLRFGIGNKNNSINMKEYVLKNWSNKEFFILKNKKINNIINIIFSFIFYGLQETINSFNKIIDKNKLLF